MAQRTLTPKARHLSSLFKWYRAMKQHFAKLPSMDNRVSNPDAALQLLKDYQPSTCTSLVLPTPGTSHFELDRMTGLVPGEKVSVASDDTGRDE